MPSRRKVLKYALSAGAVAAGGLAMLLPRRANAYYAGPVSDHFDGQYFFNPDRKQPHGLARVASLYVTERREPWPTSIASPFSDRPPASVEGPHARVAFIGHASWLIQTAGLSILIDPVWNDRVSPVSFAGPTRVNPPGIAFDALPRIDAILVTHNHFDHLDLPTLARLWARDRPRIVTPLGNDMIMRQAVPELAATTLDWRQSMALSPAVRVHAEPTQHWSARGLRDRRHALWASFVIETPAGRIYAVGDSGFGDGSTFSAVRSHHPGLALALLPIGAYEPRWFMAAQHMNPDESVRAFELCGARSALGHHWGTFQLTSEAYDRPLNDLAAALSGHAVAPERFRAVRPGEVHVIGA